MGRYAPPNQNAGLWSSARTVPALNCFITDSERVEEQIPANNTLPAKHQVILNPALMKCAYNSKHEERKERRRLNCTMTGLGRQADIMR